MKIFHGSEFIIEKPKYGEGKPNNDYGKGFYCTESIELAKEWGSNENGIGYSNAYELNLDGLKVLSLNSGDYNILHWLTLLVENRTFRLSNPVAKDARDYLIRNFSIDVSAFDVIIGYRADDSYFSFASDFLNNAISVDKLSKAMRLGNLGEQIVLKSEKAFSQLVFVEALPVENEKYYGLKKKRDANARAAYLKSGRSPSYAEGELYVIDLMRQEVKQDDPRLQ